MVNQDNLEHEMAAENTAPPTLSQAILQLNTQCFHILHMHTKLKKRLSDSRHIGHIIGSRYHHSIQEENWNPAIYPNMMLTKRRTVL